jgi:hypothetical protein
MGYKTFSMDDTDAGRASIVVASDMIRALELFKRAHGTYPERVRDMTADGETVIIEGLQEIEMRF